MPERIHKVVIDDSTTIFRRWFNDRGWLDTHLVGYTVHPRGGANYGTFAWVDDPSVTVTLRLDRVLIP